MNSRTAVEFDPSSEALVFTPDGLPLHGERMLRGVLTSAITGGYNTVKDGRPGEQEDRRVEHIIPPEAVKAGSYSIVIEVSCNGMFGIGENRYSPPKVSKGVEYPAHLAA